MIFLPVGIPGYVCSVSCPMRDFGSRRCCSLVDCSFFFHLITRNIIQISLSLKEKKNSFEYMIEGGEGGGKKHQFLTLISTVDLEN